MSFDAYCWFCHRECPSKLICKRCNRNYHLSCVSSESRHLLRRGPDNLKQFVNVCPECIKSVKAAERWNKGRDFEPINKKTLNSLLDYVFKLIKTDAPDPFKWDKSQFSGCFNAIDINDIERRIKENYYDSPKHFVDDIARINHNCLIIWRFASKLRIGRSISDLMLGYENTVRTFTQSISKKVQFLEDCPHCIWNFNRCPENWLTMTCPWGHHLIVVDVDKMTRPAKLIRYNRFSKRVDVILFGSDTRTRINAEKCWIPCKSDLQVHPVDCEQLVLAKQQAIKYIENLEKRLKIKMTYGEERANVSVLKDDFVKRGSSQEDADDIIELTDDETSDEPAESSEPSIVPPVPHELNDDTKKTETQPIPSTSEPMETNTDSNEGSNSDGLSDGKADGILDEDEIIDEITALDDSSFESKNSNASATVLTTIIEPASPLREPNHDNPTEMPPIVPEPVIEEPNWLRPKPEPISKEAVNSLPSESEPITKEPANLIPSVPELEKSVSISLSSKASDPSVDALTDSHSQAPEPKREPSPSFDPSPSPSHQPTTPSPITTPLSTSETLNGESPMSSPTREQFAIVSDEELDIQEPEPIDIDEPPISLLDSSLRPEFIVEDDPNIPDEPSSKCQPLSPFNFSCICDDTVFESTITANVNNLFPDRDEPNQSKKMKLDPNSFDLSSAIKRLQQQLEFAETENQLHLQRIRDAQDHLRLTKQMEETRFKGLELQFKSQINSLQGELETEKKFGQQMAKSLELSAAKGLSLIDNSKRFYEAWQARLEDTVKAKDDEHRLKMNLKNEEIDELKRKLSDTESEKMDLEQKLNALQSKYNKLANRFKSIFQEFGDDANTSLNSN